MRKSQKLIRKTQELGKMEIQNYQIIFNKLVHAACFQY